MRDPHHGCLSNMPIDELATFLKEGHSIYGYGCLSEPYRLFSWVADEVELAELGGAHPDSFENLMALSSTLRRPSAFLWCLRTPATLRLRSTGSPRWRRP
jgi:hypothetical protein